MEPEKEKNNFCDTREIVAQLDAAIPIPEKIDEVQEYRYAAKTVSSVLESLGDLFSSSFIILLANVIGNTGLFFTVLLITLWADCPRIIWGTFLFFCLAAPVILCVLNVRLLCRISKNSGNTARMTIREY